MAMDEPIVGGQSGVDVVQAEVVVGHTDSSIGSHGDRGKKCLAIAWGNAGRSLINLNRRRPGEAAVSGHSESDAGVLAIAEAVIFPDRVEIASVGVHREI